MAGLVPAIHVFACCDAVKTRMPGTSPGMTSFTVMRKFYWLGFKPDSEADPSYRTGFSGADNCSVRSLSVRSTTVSIGAVSSYT